MAKDNPSLQRAIIGALRATFNDHGPITPEWFDSAAKRILGQLQNAKADGLAAALASRRFAGMSKEELADHQSAAASSYWDGMSKKERSAEWKRRAAKAWETRRAKAADKAGRDERGKVHRAKGEKPPKE